MKKDSWLELTNGVCWAIIFSLAAIIMSIVALAHTHPRALYSTNDKTVVMGFDYIGVIIAILALLVTFLVGWQIYKTIEHGQLNRRMDDMEHIAEGYMQFSVGMTRLKGNPYDTLLHCVIALEHLNAATHAKYEIIFDVLDVLSDSSRITLTKSDKRRLLSALRKTNEPYAEELADKFKDWPTND